MPLIIVSGRPCTGKTYFAGKLQEFLEAAGKKVVLVNEESLKISKKEGYKSSAREKDTRGNLKSEMEHALTPDCFVILDSLNYIKGYRYELYCTARTARSPHCVVWVGSEESKSNEWNEARIKASEDAYDEKTLVELRQRFECPNDSNRWDNPLFKVCVYKNSPVDPSIAESKTEIVNSSSGISENAITKPVKSSWKLKKKPVQPVSDDFATSIPIEELSLSESKPEVSKVPIKGQISFSGSLVSTSDDFSQFIYYEEVLQNILDHLSTTSVPVPNSSTVTPLHAQADLLYELDRTSQEILQLIMTHQSESSEGTPLKLLDYDRSFTLHRPVSLSELQRYRRQFVKINGQHPPTTTKAIGASFIDYLALQI